MLFGSELIIDLKSLLEDNGLSCEVDEFLDLLEEFMSVDNELEYGYFIDGKLYVCLEKAEGLWLKEYTNTIINELISVDKYCA